MSITVLQKEDFEADDILATLATQGAEQGFDVLVCSGDRDTIQLVNDDVTLLYPNVQGVSQLKRYDRAAVIERYGVPPEQYPDIAALVGETSDNLPGVPKVGEKTAVKWLGQFGTLDALLENADKVTRRRRRQPARAPRRRAPQPHAQPPAARRRAAGRRSPISKCKPMDAQARARHLRAPRVQDPDPAGRRAGRHRAADGGRDLRRGRSSRRWRANPRRSSSRPGSRAPTARSA